MKELNMIVVPFQFLQVQLVEEEDGLKFQQFQSKLATFWKP